MATTSGDGFNRGAGAPAPKPTTSSTTLRVGSRGDAVKALQQKLGIPADGIYGPQTEAAVRRFQQANGLAVDGIAGPQTLGKVASGGKAPSGGGGSTAPKKPASGGGGSTGGGSAGGGGGGDAADTAANLGYSMAFFNSDPELKGLLNSAVKENWTPAKFVAKLQSTKWFKKNGEAARQMWALKTSDPATFNQRVGTARQQIASVAWKMGAPVPGAQMAKLAEQALTLGWNDEQIKAAITPYIKAGKDGLYQGGAASVQMQLRELVSAYGYSPTTSQMGGWIKGIVQGTQSIEQVKQILMNQASSKFPALRERLQAGETLDDIVAPYKDSYSRVLEVNPKNISVRDQQITKALSSKDKDGKPNAMSIWEFENTLRQDPRWLSTKNAQDQLVGETRKALQSFGLMN